MKPQQERRVSRHERPKPREIMADGSHRDMYSDAEWEDETQLRYIIPGQSSAYCKAIAASVIDMNIKDRWRFRKLLKKTGLATVLVHGGER